MRKIRQKSRFRCGLRRKRDVAHEIAVKFHAPSPLEIKKNNFACFELAIISFLLPPTSLASLPHTFFTPGAMNERHQQTPRTPYFNPPAGRRTTYLPNSMQPPSNDMYINNNTNSSNKGGSGGGIGSANSRWSMSSNMRQSINSQPRSSMLNSSVMIPQRPSPMRPLTENDYGALNSSVMGPPANR